MDEIYTQVDIAIYYIQDTAVRLLPDRGTYCSQSPPPPPGLTVRSLLAQSHSPKALDSLHHWVNPTVYFFFCTYIHLLWWFIVIKWPPWYWGPRANVYSTCLSTFVANRIWLGYTHGGYHAILYTRLLVHLHPDRGTYCSQAPPPLGHTDRSYPHCSITLAKGTGQYTSLSW